MSLFAGLAPARRRFLWVVIGLLGLGVVVTLGLLLAQRDDAVTPVSQDSTPPVLLVPGYGGSTTALEVLADRLRGRGREVTVVRLTGGGTGDLREQAKVFDAAASRAMKAAGAKSVDVVGYSAGGITVRLWVRDLGGASVARRIITLAAPHHGTDLAALATDLAGEDCPTACTQLATDSDLLRALNAKDETPAGPLWISIWTTADRTVVPPESGSLKGSLAFSLQSICPDDQVGHGALPRDPAIAEIIGAELGRALPSTPEPSVCG